jgi:hypothetical protein
MQRKQPVGHGWERTGSNWQSPNLNSSLGLYLRNELKMESVGEEEIRESIFGGYSFSRLSRILSRPLGDRIHIYT